MRGLSRALLLSVLVHALVVALVYAIPLDKSLRPETISVDFTLVDYEKLIDGAEGTGPAPKSPAVPLAASKTKSAFRASTVKKDPVERNIEVGDRPRDERSPAADPAQNDELAPILSPNARQEATASSSDGPPVPGSPGKGGRPAEGEGRSGYASVASIGLGGAGDSGDLAGGGHATILRQIRDSVMKNVIYPEKARRMGWEGKVILSFTVHEDGSIHDARITQGSGSLVLDQAAKEALMKSSVQARFAQKFQVFLPIEYRLK
jgi:periplasmic protein TonB